MIHAWSTPAVYAAEAALMAPLEDGELMARAVEGLVEVTLARVEQQRARRVVALVGGGNNGADALYAAAGLALAGVSVAAVHRPGRVHEGALAAAQEGGVVLLADESGAAPRLTKVTGRIGDALAEADLVLDGIFGIGGRAGLPEWAARWVSLIPDHAYVIAVDVPSGQAPDGGAVHPAGVFADETVTFSALKPVHVLPPTEAACGRITVVDIGLWLSEAPAVCRITRDDVPALWPVPTASDDKYTRGVVGVIAGSQTYPGAAVLCVSAAVEAGVGMVRYIGPDVPAALVAAAAPEAVPGVGRVAAWVIGPGLVADDLDDAQRGAIDTALASDVPVVLDAGGLDLLQPGWDRSAPTLLTPHAGECARLLDRLEAWPADVADDADEETPEVRARMHRRLVEADPVAAARALARATGAVVLLKGASTVVVDGADTAYSQADAPAWLATAGSGDVLAGLLGALAATKGDLALVGALGALVHGLAADDANPGGPVRALAVAGALPRTIGRLLRR